MHFSAINNESGSKFTKIAIVTALHVALGAAVMHSMSSKTFKVPEVIEDIMIFTPEAPKPPPPPPEPPKPKQKTAPQPKIVAPKVEVEVQQPPPVESQVQTTAEAQPEAEPGPVVEAPPAPAEPAKNTGEMFSAALANAGDCAKPDYPAKAARNGDTGTVNLALLIGPNGRVTDSKIQKSSGSRELDRAAQQALALCTFKPAMANGEPQSAWGKMAYVWTLD